MIAIGRAASAIAKVILLSVSCASPVLASDASRPSPLASDAIESSSGPGFASPHGTTLVAAHINAAGDLIRRNGIFSSRRISQGLYSVRVGYRTQMCSFSAMPVADSTASIDSTKSVTITPEDSAELDAAFRMRVHVVGGSGSYVDSSIHVLGTCYGVGSPQGMSYHALRLDDQENVLVRHGVTSLTKSSPGFFTVKFARRVDSCVYALTPMYWGFSVGVYPGSAPTELEVQIVMSSGGFLPPNAKVGFSLTVQCLR